MLSKITGSLLVLFFILAGCRKDDRKVISAPVAKLSVMSKDSLLLFIDSLKNSPAKTDLKKNPYYHIAMGYYYAKIAKYRLSKQLFNLALNSVNDNDVYTIGKIYNGLANASLNLGNNPEALKYYAKALNIFRKINDPKSQAGVHSNLAQLFQLNNDNTQARVHIRTGLQLLSNHKKTTYYMLTLHAMANVYGQSNLIDSALAIDKQGIAIAKSMNAPDYLSMFYDNKANCFMYSGKPDSARFYFNKCLKIDIAAENSKQQSDTWLNLGTLATIEKQPDSAEKYFKRSILLADHSGYNLGKMYALKSLADLYESRQQLQSSMQALKTYYSVKDSLANEKKEAAIAEWKAVFDTEQKEQEIKLGKDRLERKNLLVYGIAAISTLAMLTIYFAAKKSQIRKEKSFNEIAYQTEQKAAADVINAEEVERRRIAAELHDGVGQTMTAAWLNLQAIGKAGCVNKEQSELLQTTTALIQESCNEIRGISHNMMPDVLLLKGLVPAVRAFTASIAQDHLSVAVSADEQVSLLHKMQELMLYRVIQECVQNTLKHAKATELDISINNEPESISIMMEDNGQGFDLQNIIEKEGMGINSIRSRVNFLKGTVEWNSSKKYGGTLVAIHIPFS